MKIINRNNEKPIEITTITKLKNRKAAGLNGIPNELIKYGGSILADNIAKLFQKILAN